VNTAHATVRVLECRVADPHTGSGTASPAVARRICATRRPFRPGPGDLGFSATEIVYAVTPARTGRIRVEGADVSYLAGDDSGSQHAGSGSAFCFVRAKR
jgi:hypothetical protein